MSVTHWAERRSLFRERFQDMNDDVDVEEYRRGYEAGKGAGIALTAMRSMTSFAESDDYQRGYRHAQEGRSFDPYRD